MRWSTDKKKNRTGRTPEVARKPPCTTHPWVNDDTHISEIPENCEACVAYKKRRQAAATQFAALRAPPTPLPPVRDTSVLRQRLDSARNTAEQLERQLASLQTTINSIAEQLGELQQAEGKDPAIVRQEQRARERAREALEERVSSLEKHRTDMDESMGKLWSEVERLNGRVLPPKTGATLRDGQNHIERFREVEGRLTALEKPTRRN
jgi:chromosome segregation ATPase